MELQLYGFQLQLDRMIQEDADFQGILMNYIQDNYDKYREQIEVEKKFLEASVNPDDPEKDLKVMETLFKEQIPDILIREYEINPNGDVFKFIKNYRVAFYATLYQNLKNLEEKKEIPTEIKEIPTLIPNRTTSLKSPISFEDMRKLDEYNKKNPDKKINYIIPKAQFDFFSP